MDASPHVRGPASVRLSLPPRLHGRQKNSISKCLNASIHVRSVVPNRLSTVRLGWFLCLGLVLFLVRALIHDLHHACKEVIGQMRGIRLPPDKDKEFKGTHQFCENPAAKLLPDPSEYCFCDYI